MSILGFFRMRWFIVLHDLLWVPLAVVGAFWMWHNLGWIPRSSWVMIAALIAVALPLHAVTFWITGCFRGIWRFASIPDLTRFVLAVGGGALLTAGLYLAYSPSIEQPRAVLALYPVFLLIGLVGARILYRMVLEYLPAGHRHRGAALVVGAGQAGNLLIRDLIANGPFVPVGILDDDPSKLGQDLHRVRVVGNVGDLERIARDKGATAVLVSMPSASRAVLNDIVTVCASLGIECRMLPSLAELANGRVGVSDLRPVTVGDLLGRDSVHFEFKNVARFLEGKTVMVTGGGGSIGSELCRQVARYKPAKLVILENSEFNLYKIDQELQELLDPSVIVARLGDCKHIKLVDRIMRENRPDVVFHAAAYKHVPLVEHNILEGVANNVLGTRVVAEAAVRYGVGTFVLISTDKTVNPTNYMGASKRVAELFCQSRNRETGTHFITTRFGNVLASAGSVVPLFEEQIRKGGPITVTHPDIARYFMTIPEAGSLILQSGAMGCGGEIFVLDMGELVRIRDLAEKMIQLSGLQPGRDIEIQYTGLRPGEKLFEELFYGNEQLGKTTHPKLLLANSTQMMQASVDAAIERMEAAMLKGDVPSLHRAIKEVVPEFTGSPPPSDGSGIAKSTISLVR